MIKKITPALLIAMILLRSVSQGQSVLTQHNDLNRTGLNDQETQLTTANVNQVTFGRLGSYTCDDQVFTQPLVARNVNMGGGVTKNLLLFGTVNNTVYAYDADDVSHAAYWTTNFTASSGVVAAIGLGNSMPYRPPNKNDIHPNLCGGQYADFSGQFGITGTPVIDPSTNTMYFVSRSVRNDGTVDNHTFANDDYAYSNAGFYMLLHAVDIRTGAEQSGSPVVLKASSAGTAPGNVSGRVYLDPRRNQPRPGLTLYNGYVYIAFSAHCDMDYYHGWVIGYNAANIGSGLVGGEAPLAYCTTPVDGRGGIWMSGGGLAVDPTGRIYFTTGNGVFNGPDWVYTTPGHPSVNTNRGESVMHITPNATFTGFNNIAAGDWFTPAGIDTYNNGDLDFPIQIMLLPNTNNAITGNKDGYLYVLDRDNMGGWADNTPDQVKQKVQVGNGANMHSNFAYYRGASVNYFYQLAENTALKAYPVTDAGLLGSATVGNIGNPTGQAGGYMSVSSNGSDDNSAILWINQASPGFNANQSATCPGLLRAVKAADVTQELWNSSMKLSDGYGYFSKMNAPTISSGKVYVATLSGNVSVFGLTPSACGTAVTDLALKQTATASSQSGGAASNAVDGDDYGTYWQSDNSDNQWLQVDLGASLPVCQVAIMWQAAYASDFQVQTSPDGSTWTTQDHITNPQFPISSNLVTTSQMPASLSTRYVRIQCNTRKLNYGFAIYSLKVYGTPAAKQCSPPANVDVPSISANGATATWDPVSGASSYEIDYRASDATDWIVKTSTTNSYTFASLANGKDYIFQVRAVCTAGGYSDYSEGAFFLPGNGCGLPTRFHSQDVGEVPTPGTTCSPTLNGPFSTSATGSFGGTSDAFQYCNTSMVTGESIIGQVTAQDADAGNLIGIMMRDGVSSNNRFAYVARDATLGYVFMYRAVTGGPVVTVTTGVTAVGEYIRLVNNGTTFAAYYSNSASGPWTQIGTTQDLGFTGGGTSSAGVAAAGSSASPTKLISAVLDNYSESTIPLPVDLLSFTARNMNDNYVRLDWSTAQEVNNDHFAVQRSRDGLHFSTFNTVPGVGNSSVPQYYTTNDEQPYNGLDYYRLVQFDRDGKSANSPVVQVRFGKEYSPVLFPNPADAFVTIEAGDQPLLDIRIFSTTGAQVFEMENAAGQSRITIPVSHLASGIYFVKMQSSGKIYEIKLMKR